MKIGFGSAAILLSLAAAVPAAPPLSIPVPRLTPEQEEQMRIEAEQAELLATIDEAAQRAVAAEDTTDAEAPEDPDVQPAPPPPADDANPPPADDAVPPPADVTVPPPPPSPPPPTAATVPPPADAESSDDPSPAAAPPADSADVFRRDPFWPIHVARTRKAEHDAAVAARIEEEKRRAAIEKFRKDAAAKGMDVEELDDDELADLAADESGLPLPSRSKGNGPSSFGGATDAEWESAFAKIPPRSGYLGGKKPALMLKGIKKPFFEGDELCVTNRGTVFRWRVSKVDFRAYTHDLERIKASPETKSE